mmetsp:Transcript_42562/g.96184  ORF Transcript_42562/g.96184 Transcript_42562/m.96184 type:complete len:296 (+) Transcript_42562:78-965(+)
MAAQHAVYVACVTLASVSVFGPTRLVSMGVNPLAGKLKAAHAHSLTRVFTLSLGICGIFVGHDKAVGHILRVEVGDGLVDLRHGALHDGRADLVACAELEHLQDLLAPPRVRGGDVVHCEAHREDVDGDGRTHADKAHGAARPEEREELGEVDRLLRGKGDEDKVERGRRRLHLLLVGVRYELVCAILDRLLLLRRGGGQGGDLAAERAGKLERHVAQAAEAEDADAVACLGLRPQRSPDRLATAEERCRRRGVAPLWDGEAETGVLDADVVGEAALVALAARALDVGTQLLVAP